MLGFILLQAAGGSGELIQTVLLLVGMLLVFYFFMVRPNQQKQKTEKKFRESLKKGDKVVTIGGIHGRVVSLLEEKVVVEVDKGTKLLVERTAIAAQPSLAYQKESEE